MKTWIVLITVISLSSISFAYSTPDLNKTPGVLCSTNDPDFSGLDYPEKIARCHRNISKSEKIQVAQAYGNIPESQWANYEFDHMIPLCAGGSNDSRNLWPQPINEAHNKDKLEDEVCLGLRNGTISQEQAVQKVKQWFQSQNL